MPHRPRCHLHVLLAQGAHHIRRGQVAGRQAHRIEPQPHGVFALAKDDYIAHTLDAFDRVSYINVKVIADKQIVVLSIVRIETGPQHKGAGNFGDAQAGCLHLGRQTSQSGSGPVLNIHGGNIKVPVKVKCGGDSAGPIIAAGGTQVAHAFSPIDGLLQQSGHAGFHCLGVGTGIKSAHGHLWRRKIWELGNRQGRN